MAKWTPRDGQWVKWLNGVHGAHVSRDGKTVGVYHKARVDGNGIAIPERVVPVSKDEGEGIPAGNGLAFLTFFPEQCAGLEPVTDKRDIPEKRLVGNPDFKPRP